MNNLHIVELSSIVEINKRIELFDKNNQDKILLIIPINELELLKSGWQKHNQRIFYNGNTYWLHPKYLEKLPEKNRNTNQLGIRVNNDYQKKFQVQTNFLKQIPRNEPIIILFEESKELSIRNFVVDQISDTLTKKGYNIFNFSTIQPKADRGLATADVILGYLTGYKIKGEEFTVIEMSEANNVYYYDDDSDMLNYLNDIDDILKDRYENSSKDLQKKIYDELNFAKKAYMLHLMYLYRNDANPIKKNSIKLGLQKEFEHLVSYNKFKTT